MSFLRAKRRAVNNNVFLDNRLTTFTNVPMKQGDLTVEKSETVAEDLAVGGDLSLGGDLRAANYYATGNYYLDNYILIPFGTIIQSAAVVEPAGWMDCNGRSLVKSAYADLFNAILYTYGGSGDTFNLPDMRGRVGVGAGVGAGSLTARNLGTSGGEETHTLTTTEIPAHAHTLTRRSNADAGAFDTTDANRSNSCASTTDRTDLGLFSTYSTGGGQPHNVMQPFVVLRYFIKY